ncbi:S1C family serine protease [Lentibacillus sediminis]|uniref:S1C family serine protease n=1 Tax=Lentibacillus sediminis TaxID=1940529 RepID=UPI000C1B901D|nr:trypsin-like peptidase domain-containing protein [Lentibacillus sediminis]
MHKKRLPIIISASVLIIGVVLCVLFYEHWQKQELAVSDPVVNRVSTEGQQLDLQSIIYEAEKNVVQVEGQTVSSTITGSGFIYNEKGDIITNAHVIQDAEVIYVRTADARIYPAAVVGIGETTDVAVIRVPELAGESYSPVARDAPAEIGEEVMALGSPHGFQSTVTLGIISGTERNFTLNGYTYSNAYQISAPITHGNSGGPLINRSTGKVIGINSVGTEDGTIGFSIPIREVIEQIEKWSNEAQNEQLEFASAEDIIDTNNPEAFLLDAEYLVEYFMESIEIRDYLNAYTLMGSSMQDEVSYSDFRDRYIHIVDLEFSNLTSSVTEDNRIQITLNTTAELKEKEAEETENETETVKESYTYTFIVAHENDQLRILQTDRSTK